MPEKEVKLSIEQLLSLHQNQRNQYENLLQQINSMNSLIVETNLAQAALKELNEPGKDEVMFSLGAGVYIDAAVADLKKVKANIGGNIVEEITVKKALEKLDERKQDIQKNIKKLREQEAAMRKNLGELERALATIEQHRRKAMQQKRKEEETTPDVS